MSFLKDFYTRLDDKYFSRRVFGVLIILFGLYVGLEGYPDYRKESNPQVAEKFQDLNPSQARAMLEADGFTADQIGPKAYLVLDSPDPIRITMGEIESLEGNWEGVNPRAYLYSGYVSLYEAMNVSLGDPIMELDATTGEVKSSLLGGLSNVTGKSDTWMEVSRPGNIEDLIGEQVSIVFEMDIRYPVPSGGTKYVYKITERTNALTGYIAVTRDQLDLIQIIKAAEEDQSYWEELVDSRFIYFIGGLVVIGLSVFAAGYFPDKNRG